MVDDDVAVEGRGGFIVLFLELDIGIVEGSQTGEVSIGELLIVFVVEVAWVNEGVGREQVWTESESVAIIDIRIFVSDAVELQGICGAVCVDKIVEITDMILLMRVWCRTVVLYMKRYVHRDVNFCASSTGVGFKGNDFFVELIISHRT